MATQKREPQQAGSGKGMEDERAGHRRQTAQDERPDAQGGRQTTQDERLDAQNRRQTTQGKRPDAQNKRQTTQDERPDTQNRRQTAQSERPDAQNKRQTAQGKHLNSQGRQGRRRGTGKPKVSARPQAGPGRTHRQAASGKKAIYRKSKYYRQRQLRMRIILLIVGIAVLVCLAFVVRSCVSENKSQENGTSASGNTGTASGKDEISKEEGSLADASNASSDAEGNAENSTDGDDSSGSSWPEEPVTLTVSVVGDCTLGTDEYFDYSTSLNAYFDSYGKDYFLQNVKGIFEADDLTIANMEGVLTDSDQRADKTFAFKAPASYAGILSSGSVEAVNTANNHSHDYGEDSYTDTLAALDGENIVHFGYDETAVMEVKGIRIGLVGIYELDDHLERTQQLKDNIAKVKAEGAQLTIVIFHWGNETETVPDTNQTTLGRLAIEEGADLVCGHHPHVLQGIEEYKGKNIVYSLGNFCFGGNNAPSDMDTMIFQQTFTITSEGVQADNVTNIIPCSVSSAYGYNNYQPTPAEGDEKTRIMEKIQERSSWIDTN